jgi:GH15 family glucan-1,4-alpha-glucosidase
VPIQEDETALVIWALWEHYDKFREIEFVRKFYRSLITKAADFMVSFRHEATRLPAPSWNLWEDRRGIHTFTCSTVVSGLRAAAKFARLFAEHARAENMKLPPKKSSRQCANIFTAQTRQIFARFAVSRR